MDKEGFLWLFWIFGAIGACCVGAGIGCIISPGWGWLTGGILLFAIVPATYFINKEFDI